MLAVTQGFVTAAHGASATVTIPVPSYVRTLGLKVVVTGLTHALSDVDVSFQVAPAHADGSAGTYVTSKIATQSLAPAASGSAEAEVVFPLQDNPYKVDPQTAYIKVTITNNDSTNPVYAVVLTEDKQQLGF